MKRKEFLAIWRAKREAKLGCDLYTLMAEQEESREAFNRAIGNSDNLHVLALLFPDRCGKIRVSAERLIAHAAYEQQVERNGLRLWRKHRAALLERTAADLIARLEWTGGGPS